MPTSVTNSVCEPRRTNSTATRTRASTSNTFNTFGTAGIFHRSCEGLQFGVVWDALNDERYHSRQFHQLRSELSIRGGCHEFGFTGIFGFNEQTLLNQEEDDVIFQASDQYLLFYRLHGCNGGEGRFFAGVNNDSDGIIGSDMLLPVGDRFSVQTGFTYLIPNEKNGTAAHPGSLEHRPRPGLALGSPGPQVLRQLLPAAV